MKPIKFTVAGEPESKLRARTYSNYHVKNGKVKHWVSTVTPTKTKINERNIRYQALNARMKLYDKPLECDIMVLITAYMSIPDWSKIKKERARIGLIRPNTKPDCDNIMKSVLDAMNTKKRKDIIINEGVYLDDKQIVKAVIQQFYSDEPRTEVEVIPLEKNKYDIAYRKGRWLFIDPDTKKAITDVNSENGNDIIKQIRNDINLKIEEKHDEN